MRDERLNCICDERKEIRELKERLSEAGKLLRVMEWDASQLDGTQYCSFCEAYRDTQEHKPDCRLAAFLAKG